MMTKVDVDRTKDREIKTTMRSLFIRKKTMMICVVLALIFILTGCKNKYNMAVELKEQGKPKEAVEIFLDVDTPESETMIRTIILEVMKPQKAIDSATSALESYNLYIKSISNDLFSFAFSGSSEMILGSEADTSDPNVAAVLAEMDVVKNLLTEYNETFTNEMIEKCSEEVKALHEAYQDWANYVITFFSPSGMQKSFTSQLAGTSCEYNLETLDVKTRAFEEAASAIET